MNRNYNMVIPKETGAKDNSVFGEALGNLAAQVWGS